MGFEKQGREQYSGSLFKACLTGLDSMGLRSVVRTMVPVHVQRLMDTPPPSTAWLEGDELTLLFNAVQRLQGLEGLRQLGFAAMYGSMGRFLKPLMQTVSSRYGRGPAALFQHLDSIFRPFFQELDFQFLADGARSGTVQIRSKHAKGPASWAAWEGALRILFNECGVTTGVISPAVLSEGGLLSSMRVRW
ncbi:hypothetical protein POL68_21365 [Stigmatella sp. ncwal1]|uniref:Myxococcales-restricted protein, TIGR02265 family n=1 Tax=Stigmatella ashevillensis TaxID=2995309 RepID=A0ABT5DD33_9BACT|nr:hypothetical protein [Stigmatella ashevillena]MDC0711035.1 hypothetical protein [Stigmatella ashevillena]